MPRKPEPVVASNVIKWTEEEWQAIATRVLEDKGPTLLHSPELEEVKAKDVFHAQNVLPDSRHRKLISISQGFQAIRQRLRGILQALETIPQHDLFTVPTPAVHGEAAPSERALTGQSTPEASNGPITINSEPVAGTPAEVPPQEIEAVSTTPSPRQRAPAAVTVSDEEVSMEERARPAVPLRAPIPFDEKATFAHATSRRPSRQALPQSAGEDLIELARPFVAMVCQEFANALVKTMMEKGGTQGMVSLFQAAAGSPIHGIRGAVAESTIQANDASDDDDDHFADDVQPLFDPKLPPSANSSFKPVIALIATGTRDFEDLQQLYPQLELNVVALEDLRTAPSLRNCQRMIGLREDVPAPADEFLRKTFGNRYVRITGGIGQIREQLNAWLNNPGTMNAAVAGWPRKQGNGKGQSNGYPKKKQFRRPRPAA